MTFTLLDNYGVEQLVYCQDKQSGLRAIIAIHDTTLGPALGGTRMYPYASEEEALEDVVRLARGMTYKAAAAGLNLGGGKAVIIGDPKKDKSEALFRAFGKYVNTLQGRYITAEDVGTTVTDMDYIHQETRYVTGVSPEFGSSGNPSPVTAYGVFQGIRAAANEVYGSPDLSNKVVAVQGVGSVAYHLCGFLKEAGAELIVTDVVQEHVDRAVRDYNAVAVGVHEIYTVPCDVFAPCAMGGILNDDTIQLLQARIIAGAANNQLQEERHGDLLHERGILYAPDYVVNSGGLINVADELQGYQRERALNNVGKIYEQLGAIFELARQQELPAFRAADMLAIRRIEQYKKQTITA
ncbi:Glu/Leu/Phe/Val dehydrogenase [Paenibacillus barcinonensis]|uniref:Glu/Leu/Phe/Val dehydrogenase n=1 Tax=Paenibacillus barcinonensis TaxID=198119 RepID=A0A2V4V964_PAEBA|nr:Glu/Leu/Phe/Val dehydrogenase [Paenibacillus barcinonensis]PYE48532.1 leucine dehydrogenase [Paenibacillus barcinonensis]QKS58768.1 Glu/Leu/Phe/Val dehydrogenase [Paenibacillus barcinonensis]